MTDNCKEKVSIIVPVYNSELYLKSCVDSLINQRYADIEIILVDDGSKDNSGKLCDEFKEKNEKIVVIHKENGGTSTAKNLGIENAKGKWIVFVDSDDYVDDNYVDHLIENAISLNSDFVASGFEINYSKDNYSVPVGFPDEKAIFKDTELKDGIYTIDLYSLLNVDVCKIYKKTILIENNIRFDKKLNTGEDLVFNCEYLKYVHKIVLLSEISYHYIRRDEVSLVNLYRSNMIEMVKQCNQARYELYNFYDMLKGKYEQIYAKSYIGYMSSCVPNMYRRDCKITKLEKCNSIKQIMYDDKLQYFIKIYNSDQSFVNKLFVNMCKRKNVKLFLHTYSLFFFFRYNLEPVYRKIRRKIIY